MSNCQLAYHDYNREMTVFKSTIIDVANFSDMQVVYIGNKVSTIKPVLTGVLQGSLIGPLLFNTFINDIVKARKKCLFIVRRIQMALWK